MRLDAEQHFTCQQCGRCCRRGWEILLTIGETEALRRANAARWYRESGDGPEGTDRDPFEPIPHHAPFHRIRKRPDGACGFLSPENRCRIHEELGGDQKPLTCRMFPFRFHPADGGPVVTTSFSCPTVVANKGEGLEAQARDVGKLRKEWFRVFPEKAPALRLVPGRPLSAHGLATLRAVLRQMLDRRGPRGRADLRANVGRMARTLEDLSRHRVVHLADVAFAEYLELTTRYAAGNEKPPAPRPPSRLGRLLFRGFLFVTAAARQQLGEGQSWGPRLGLRWRRLRLLAHFHGLGPAVDRVDLAAARRTTVSFEDPAVHGIAYSYLRASIETLGTGKWPVLVEMAVSVAFLNAALVLAAMRAGLAGRPSVDAADLTEGLMDAVDLTHAETTGILGSILGTLSGGVESLYLFQCGTA